MELKINTERKISVYGGRGFVGSEFCEKYNAFNIEIMDRDQIIPAENTTDVLYLISTVDNYNVLTNSFIDIETNLIHLMKVLDACKHKNIKFTFVSSWFVYGEVELPAKEHYCCDPKGFYSITKRTAEQLLESYCKTFDMRYNIARLGNVVGKKDLKVSKKKNALQYLINQLKENQPVYLYNRGNFYRDYIGVEDVANGLMDIIKWGVDGEIYNIGSGQAITFKEIIKYAAKKIKSESVLGTMEPTKFHSIVQVEDMYLDITKIKQLGWSPTKSIFELVDELI
jgi:nucleoside-diphosphate-sugar epimerase